MTWPPAYAKCKRAREWPVSDSGLNNQPRWGASLRARRPVLSRRARSDAPYPSPWHYALELRLMDRRRRDWRNDLNAAAHRDKHARTAAGRLAGHDR
jgi:hypothetical protein